MAASRYANCRHHNSSFKVLAHWLDVPPRGFGLAELFHRFCQQHRNKTLVILNEIDLMSATTAKLDLAKGVYDRYRRYCLEHREQPFS